MSDGMRGHFSILEGHDYMNLTTFRRSGEPVRTPVWFAKDGEKLYVYTGRASGKAKRIRNHGGVIVGPCDRRGRPLGPEVAGVARLLAAEESAHPERLLREKYGAQMRLFRGAQRLFGRSGARVYLEITPAPPDDPVNERLAERSAPGRAPRSARYRWYHAAAFGLAVNAVSASLSRPDDGERRQYEELRQAPFAPPGWVFGPAWTINNISQLWGDLRLLNLPEGTHNRRPLLALQGASWALYATFTWAYFRKRSPLLALGWTSAFHALTLGSTLLGLRVDRRFAASQVPILIWLSIATPTAAYQALYNPDPLFGTPAPLPEPPFGR
ncbi:PPOX class F420-dependent oxidoreductase [Rubrobacter calidifluminis]|uniref:PPOX class F420-dependent oxidoreductase n=1 Tax=Rubrobacter calidifluminis TaxID=1392640 RepID=UPI00235DFE0D|nr:PPOX class F420-dependent oxidoreductase [Rubrobacter calidifluminis]